MVRQFVSVTLFSLIGVLMAAFVFVSFMEGPTRRQEVVLGDADNSGSGSTSSGSSDSSFEIYESSDEYDNSGSGSYNSDDDTYDDEDTTISTDQDDETEDSTSSVGVGGYDPTQYDDDDYESNSTGTSTSSGTEYDEDFDDYDDSETDSYGSQNDDSRTVSVVDRLAHLDEPTRRCLLKRLGEDKLNRLRYQSIYDKEDAKDIVELEEKARVCFESFSEISNINEASGHISTFDDDVRDCLINNLGESVYIQVVQEGRSATRLEKSKVKSCFEEDDIPQIHYQTDKEDIMDEVKSCLVLALGDDRYEAIEGRGAAPAYNERKKIERCFGATAQPFTETPVYTISSSTDSCLTDALGRGRYTQIKAGHASVTEEEKSVTSDCFDEINDIQERFLPPPPVQVLFLDEEPDVVSVGDVVEIPDANGEITVDSSLVLSGKGPANSVVEIYIFSDPIVVTTQTDENGQWLYELTEPLSGESHVAYATVRSDSGEYVRSTIFNFEVLAADGALDEPLLSESEVSDEPTRFLAMGMALMAFGVVIVVGGLTYGFIALNKKEDHF